MNKGKICVAVCAETVDELIRQIHSAEAYADLIEIRFDCLSREEFDCTNIEASKRTLNKIFEHKANTPWISTFRPKEQGGNRELLLDERRNFWNAGFETEYGDFEEDIIADATEWRHATPIASHHNFVEVPGDIGQIFERLIETGADVLKIAAA